MNRDPDKGSSHKRRLNCWEVMMCGREQGGENCAENGVCPAAADQSFDEINSGKCGGRICWAVAGTFCGGCVQGSFVDKRPSCLSCDFYQMVQDEEGIANRRTKFLEFLFQENRLTFFNLYGCQSTGVQTVAGHVQSKRPGTGSRCKND